MGNSRLFKSLQLEIKKNKMEKAIVESILDVLPNHYTESEKIGSIVKIIDLLEKEINNLIPIKPNEVFVIEDLTRGGILDEDFITGIEDAQELRRVVLRGVDRTGDYSILKIKHEIDADTMKTGRIGANPKGNWYTFPGDIQLSGLILACEKTPILTVKA